MLYITSIYYLVYNTVILHKGHEYQIKSNQIKITQNPGYATGDSSLHIAILRYSGGGRTEIVPFTGGANTRQFTISRLTPSTDYTIEVAAINDFAVGVYSTGMVERTLGELMMTACIIHVARCLVGACSVLTVSSN